MILKVICSYYKKLQRDSSYKKNYAKEDLGVVSVWRMNITGKGVVVAIIDDGSCSVVFCSLAFAVLFL